MRLAGHGLVILLLTALTQVGGLAWLLALRFRHRMLAFLGAYVALSLLAHLAAPIFGREALPCFGSPLRSQSPFYCALNRTYADPRLIAVAQDLAAHMEAQFPGTVTLTLDGSFPLFDGVPLLPHLSHDDGKKLDLAYYYAGPKGYEPGLTRSPLGYFAFEAGPTDCPKRSLTLRWDMDWLQGLWPDRRLEPSRTAEALRFLAQDPRLGRIFVEPHLRTRLGVDGPGFGFQGCRAARHDDHIHIQL